MIKLISLKDTSDLIGVSVQTLRRWLTNGHCPFKVKKTPSGRIFTTLEAIRLGLDNLPDYKSKS